jgi:hypothetical protein
MSREGMLNAAYSQRDASNAADRQQGQELSANRDIATERANTQIRTGLIREALRAGPMGQQAPTGSMRPNGAAAPAEGGL